MKDRRKRYKIPDSILASSILIMSLPILNLVEQVYHWNLGISNVFLFIQDLNILQLFFIFAPFLIGIGLLFVKKWAWYSLIIYLTILFLFDISQFISQTSLYNFGIILRTFVGAILLILFLRKDIQAPYFKLYPRGFRGEKRKPIHTRVKIENTIYETRDVSERGIYVDWANCDKNLNEEIHLEFLDIGNSSNKSLKNIPKFTKASVVRIDEKGVGIAFRKS